MFIVQTCETLALKININVKKCNAIQGCACAGFKFREFVLLF